MTDRSVSGAFGYPERQKLGPGPTWGEVAEGAWDLAPELAYSMHPAVIAKNVAEAVANHETQHAFQGAQNVTPLMIRPS